MPRFEIHSSFEPAGDQPSAIEELSAGLEDGTRFQTLLGATGTGKTLSMAHVIQRHGRPTLVMSHNKTLAAQLYGELKALFPVNAVEYFVSYYDYYQPEAYVPATDTYIEKDASINEDIDRLRLRSTSSLFERDDVIVVASVSCIYGLGNPADYRSLMLEVRVGELVPRDELLRGLVDIQYHRNDFAFERGTFRVRGDTVEILPAYEEQGIRIELWGDEIERITRFEPLTGESIVSLNRTAIYPASHYVTHRRTLEEAVPLIRDELADQLHRFRRAGKLLEAQRLESRTNFDIEMMLEVGTCPGIENYSRFISRREAGERPSCLLDYFPERFLTIVDESHVSLPQIRGMFNGDKARKDTLVEFGFRLPSALDNRPLRYGEWESVLDQAVFVSATPGDMELGLSRGVVVEQIIRPTGLVDPEVEVRPVRGQVDDLLAEIHERAARGERILVTTLTKRMAEDLSEYLQSLGVRVRYMHSEINTIDRVDILRALRLGGIDVLVGINLLREGLDLPEVSLVAILDADKEGFLRDARSLIQTIGRAARNVRGTAILYADTITESMARCLDETNRRREIQLAYNREHQITPETIVKSVEEIEFSTRVADARDKPVALVAEAQPGYSDEVNREEYVKILEEEMNRASSALEFERAAMLRDQLFELRVSLEGQGAKR
ncbi:MAG: excinuclease ABC subunit UvrB [Gammaproteobacteria bacterium]|nr:excinuclease ABC subunit UvrB [Gammaproteobacteria bacterium]MDE0649926.1 excinuclease ABC subunit UvrB [Gammaproteobacteria bacterium]MXW09960.1 excinuclease ABC subunit UvrB [Gammaproteobacteria bacterium]MYC50907.1 excinuclease ABC subunit UvrB [Gammaproteobacteria bacterium]